MACSESAYTGAALTRLDITKQLSQVFTHVSNFSEIWEIMTVLLLNSFIRPLFMS